MLELFHVIRDTLEDVRYTADMAPMVLLSRASDRLAPRLVQ